MNTSIADPGARLTRVLDLLTERYGTDPWNWHTQQSPFQVLIGTVLSQRTRDQQTDLAARALFARYPGPRELAEADPIEIERCIRPVNYYKTKAARVQEISRIVMTRHQGELPADLNLLLALPGVGRKTASCVLVYGFRQGAIAVDTHVHRISNRLGVVATKTAEQTEQVLWAILPPRYRLQINELLVKHGQTLCAPRKPRCAECPVQACCMTGNAAWTNAGAAGC